MSLIEINEKSWSVECSELIGGDDIVALDKCPKCKKNVCEHTSIANIVNLPCSESQDFSTYSSDSSLIRQLFDTDIAPSSLFIDKLNSKQQKHFLINNDSTNIRPLSCQILIIDKTTTDKLIRDFFDRSSIQINNSSSKCVPNLCSKDDLDSEKKMKRRRSLQFPSYSQFNKTSMQNINEKIQVLNKNTSDTNTTTFGLKTINEFKTYKTVDSPKSSKTKSDTIVPNEDRQSINTTITDPSTVKINRKNETKSKKRQSILFHSFKSLTPVTESMLKFSKNKIPCITHHNKGKTETVIMDESSYNTYGFQHDIPETSRIISTNMYDSRDISFPTPAHRYSSLSILFILIALFIINLLQEYFILFYYWNIGQTSWLIYSIISILIGQILVSILSLFNIIDKNELNNGGYSNNTSKFECSISFLKNTAEHKSPSSINERSMYLQKYYKFYHLAAYKYKNLCKRIFMCFCYYLLCLLPGFLPICVLIRFFKHIIRYKRLSELERCKSEFRLSSYLFFNAIFHSLPLVIINSCHMASSISLFPLTINFSDLFLNEISLKAVIDGRNRFIIYLISLFISVTVGICLFITYYEFMNQTEHSPEYVVTSSTLLNDYTKLSRMSKSFLGLIEILVYFSYKFCLIISRLSIIALMWYLCREWIFIAVVVHIAIIHFLCNCFNILDKQKVTETNNKNYYFYNDSNNNNNERSTLKLSIRSKITKHLLVFTLSLLSVVDIFVNQLTEFCNINKILVYYLIYFLQNIFVLSYWIYKTYILTENWKPFVDKYLNSLQQQQQHSNYYDSSFASMFSTSSLSSQQLSSFASISTSAAKSKLTSMEFPFLYSILIFLSLFVLIIIGIVLKVLHLHIICQRFKELRKHIIL